MSNRDYTDTQKLSYYIQKIEKLEKELNFARLRVSQLIKKMAPVPEDNRQDWSETVSSQIRNKRKVAR